MGPEAGDADLWIKNFWEELHLLATKEILLEVRACQSAPRRKGQDINVSF